MKTADGVEVILARAVIDASGTFSSPNPLGADGVLAQGEREAASNIWYGIPDVLQTDRARYAGRRVLVVGSGHSAFNALIDLATLVAEAPGTTLDWVVRRADLSRAFGGGTKDQLAARGQLGDTVKQLAERGIMRNHTGFAVERVERTATGLMVSSGDRILGPFDEIIGATGFRPDLTMTRELRLTIDPIVESPAVLAPLIDPNLHRCGSVPPHGVDELSHPERDFYIIGMKSYGRAPTFLMLTGFEQARSVAAAITGDWEAARDVRLVLPETGVCTLDAAPGDAKAACCAPAAKAEATALEPDAPCLRNSPPPPVAARSRRAPRLPRAAGDTVMRDRQVIALGLSQLVGWGVLFYALIPLQHALAFGSASSSSFLITLAIVVSGIAAYPVGILLDRVGGRGVLLVGSIAGVLVLLGLAFSPAAGLLPLFVALGIVHALMLYEPAFAVISAHVPTIEARSTALRSITLLGGLASLVFVPLTALLADAAGPRVTLVVLAVLLAAVTIPSHLGVPIGPGASRSPPAEASSATRDAPAFSPSPALITVTITFGIASFVATAVLFLLLAHLSERGFSAFEGSVVLGLAGACQLVGRLLYPRLARAWSPVSIVAAGLVCQSVGMIGLLLGTAGLPLFMLAFGGGSGLLTVVRPAVVEHLFGLRGFGRTSAVIATAAVLARAAAPAAVAGVEQRMDSTIALAVLAVLSSLAAPGLLLGLGRPARGSL